MSTQLSNIKTAAEYREMVVDCHRREQESWERSDTDGFLSQWAMQQMATRYQHNAQLVEQGYVTVLAIVEIETGLIIATEDDRREGQYGAYYYIGDAAVAKRIGTKFLTLSNAAKPETYQRNNAKKGVRVEWVKVGLDQCWESRSTGRIEPQNFDALLGTMPATERLARG